MKELIKRELIGLGIILLISIPFIGIKGIGFGLLVWYLFYFPYVPWFMKLSFSEQFLLAIISGIIIGPMVWWIIISMNLGNMKIFYLTIPFVIFIIGTVYPYLGKSEKQKNGLKLD
jgi:hypothetical protein